MKLAIAILMLVGGIILGAYVGLYLCLYGGVVQVIQSAVMVPVDAVGVGVGIVRVLIAGIAGWLSAFVLIIPGAAVLAD